MVTLSDLTVTYGSRCALDVSELKFGTGLTYVLGPNGAGKSTLLRLVAGTLKPTAGTVTLTTGSSEVGAEAACGKPRVIYLPQRFSLMWWTSAEQNARYAAWARGVPPAQVRHEAQQALRAVGLFDRRRSWAARLSGGMRQRLGIAAALASQPDALLLDEPTVGLDPLERDRVAKVLAALARDKTVVVSTHILSDLTDPDARVVVLDEGEIKFDGLVSALAARHDEMSTLSEALLASYSDLVTFTG